MSRKNTDFIKKNIRDADNIGKDELAKVIREHNKNKTIKKNKVKGVNLGPAVSVQPINVGEPINKKLLDVQPIKPDLYQHLNDKSKSREPLFPTKSKAREPLFSNKQKSKEPLFSKSKKKIDYGNHDYFFIFSQDKKNQNLELNYVIFYKGEKNGNIELRYYGDLLNSEETIKNDKGEESPIGIYNMPEIMEFEKDKTIPLNESKNWYFVQPMGDSVELNQYFKNTKEGLELKESFFCTFLNNFELKNDNATLNKLKSKLLLPFESLKLKTDFDYDILQLKMIAESDDNYSKKRDCDGEQDNNSDSEIEIDDEEEEEGFK